jgi:hypothetical protein
MINIDTATHDITTRIVREEVRAFDLDRAIRDYFEFDRTPNYSEMLELRSSIIHRIQCESPMTMIRN